MKLTNKCSDFPQRQLLGYQDQIAPISFLRQCKQQAYSSHRVWTHFKDYNWGTVVLSPDLHPTTPIFARYATGAQIPNQKLTQSDLQPSARRASLVPDPSTVSTNADHACHANTVPRPVLLQWVRIGAPAIDNSSDSSSPRAKSFYTSSLREPISARKIAFCISNQHSILE